MLPDPGVDRKLSLALSNGNLQLAADLLAALLAELPQNHRDISRALAESDFDDALELIHKLHGSCAYCGVPMLKTACKQLETQLHRQRQLPAAEDIHSFDTAVNTLLTWHQTHNISTFLLTE